MRRHDLKFGPIYRIYEFYFKKLISMRRIKKIMSMQKFSVEVFHLG